MAGDVEGAGSGEGAEKEVLEGREPLELEEADAAEVEAAAAEDAEAEAACAGDGDDADALDALEEAEASSALLLLLMFVGEGGVGAEDGGATPSASNRLLYTTEVAALNGGGSCGPAPPAAPATLVPQYTHSRTSTSDPRREGLRNAGAAEVGKHAPQEAHWSSEPDSQGPLFWAVLARGWVGCCDGCCERGAAAGSPKIAASFSESIVARCSEERGRAQRARDSATRPEPFRSAAVGAAGSATGAGAGTAGAPAALELVLVLELSKEPQSSASSSSSPTAATAAGGGRATREGATAVTAAGADAWKSAKSSSSSNAEAVAATAAGSAATAGSGIDAASAGA